MNKSLIFMVCLCGTHAAIGELYIRDDGYAEDRERYADLLVDPYAARFLDRFLDPSDCHGAAAKPDREEVENSIWYSKQGEKSFPLLLEVLKREEGNLGAVRIDKALARVMSYPGNKTAFVKEVRRKLPQWKNEGYEPKQYNNMVTMSFRLLAEEGDESDIALIESMLDTDHAHPIYQKQIDRNVKQLKERLAKTKERPGKRNIDEVISPSGESAPDKKGAKGNGIITDTPSKSFWLVLAATLLLPLIALSVRRAWR
jgi:hypothetical protein